MISQAKRDLLGATCSGLCLLQCLTPVLLLLVGYRVAWLSTVGEQLHLAFLFLVPAIALWSFLPGFRCHRSRRPLLFMSVALPLLVSAVVIGGSIEIPLTVLGGLLMITAHIDNRRRVVAIRVPPIAPIHQDATGVN